MKHRTLWQLLVVALIALFLGVAGTAAVFAFIPDSGSAPSIFDDFKFSSTSNGFWHVNSVGATAVIKDSTLTLSGHSTELDRRVQTDPNATVVSLKVRAQHFSKFGVGLGIYHSGTIGMEFDGDGIKCGRGTDHGYYVDPVRAFSSPPTGKWFYLVMTVVNPYPDPKVLEKLGSVDYDRLKKVTETCAAYDSSGHLIGRDVAVDPPPNTHYVALDEAYIRTWDSGNNYQVDWFYAGPRSGDPTQAIVKT
jgi:hypothetical protein